MKRINPKTNKTFVIGETREDGKVFRKYITRTTDVFGYFKETWCSKTQFDKERLENNSTRGLREAKSQLLPKNRAKKLLRSAKERCKGIITIDCNWVEAKLNLGICELTGLPFNFERSMDGKLNPFSPSLDRKDNGNRDYTPENTRVVLTCVNFALNQFGLKTMQPIFKILGAIP